MFFEWNEVRNFWTPFFTFLLLLGVYLLILGISLAGLVTTLRNRERERAEFIGRFPRQDCGVNDDSAPRLPEIK